jgi:hypothetical protein
VTVRAKGPSFPINKIFNGSDSITQFGPAPLAET